MFCVELSCLAGGYTIVFVALECLVLALLGHATSIPLILFVESVVVLGCMTILLLISFWRRPRSIARSIVPSQDDRKAKAIVLGASEAAADIFTFNEGRTQGLDSKLKGVFWMSDNIAPELLVTVDGSELDEEKHVLTLRLGEPLNWSWSYDILGIVEWFLVTVVGYFFHSYLKFFFDETYTKGRIYIYTCGCIRIPTWLTCMQWTMDALDEEGTSWDRGIYCVPCCGKRSFFSYTLKKVLDAEGKPLDAHEEMIGTLQSETHAGVPVKGIYTKPYMQIVQVHQCTSRDNGNGINSTCKAPAQKNMDGSGNPSSLELDV